MIKFLGEMGVEPVREVGARLAMMDRIAAQSVNDTAREGRDIGVSRITRHLNLRDSYVKGKFSVRTAQPGKPTAYVNVQDEPVQVRQYGARQEFGNGGKKAGISVQVLRGGARKTLRAAFFAPLKSGGIGVYGRKSEARYPLRVLYAPSPGQMFFTITPEMTDPLAESLVRNLLARSDGAFNTSGVALGVSR